MNFRVVPLPNQVQVELDCIELFVLTEMLLVTFRKAFMLTLVFVEIKDDVFVHPTESERQEIIVLFRLEIFAMAMFRVALIALMFPIASVIVALWLVMFILSLSMAP
jgi:hypothetical protein